MTAKPTVPIGRWQQRAAALRRGLGELLLPPACAVCREAHRHGADGVVCGVCMARVVPLAQPTCDRCGHPRLSLHAPLPVAPASHTRDSSTVDVQDPMPSCRWCSRLPAYVRAVRSVCRMDTGTGAALVHALKYGGWPAVATPMARRMARVSWPADVIAERTALVPLPLSATRERERGYNQAERLATGVAEDWGLPVWRTVLRRTRHTRSQVRLTPSERSSNVSRAFEVNAQARKLLHGAHVVLVDDVITTAATMNAAAQALTEGGARIISYVTFGRAPDPGDRSSSDFDPDRD